MRCDARLERRWLSPSLPVQVATTPPVWMKLNGDSERFDKRTSGGFEMCKIKVVVFLLGVVFVFAACAFCASDLYWVSYTDQLSPCSGISVMQINALGQITIPPTFLDLGPKIPCDNYTTAMSHGGPGSLILWLIGAFDSNPVFKAQIDKNTFAVTQATEFPLLLHQDCCLQTPDGPPRFFAAGRNDILFAYGVNADGSLNGSHWRLIPRVNGIGNGGSAGVTADGRLAYGATFYPNAGKFFVQFLRADGRPTGNPVLIASGDIRQTDISNVLSGNRRLAVYVSKDTNLLMSQFIDATTGARIGSSRVIAAANPGFLQTVALDPDGRFVLFDGILCAKANMFFQALDPTGAASGNPILLLPRCAPSQFSVVGFNLLKE